jgi:hypothetical protein
MKKLLTIAVLGGLFAAGTLQAQVNIYIAGSTAFRANVFRAVKAAYDGGTWTTIVPASAGTGTGVWTATGTMTPLFGGQTVTIYASYNGSVQGLGDLNNNTLVTFTNSSPGGAAVSQVPNVTFSDVDKISTLWPNVDTIETPVAVLPFTYCRSVSCPTTVTNITGHLLRPCWDNGVVKLSFITGNTNDDGSSMYITGRNKDSGTRVCGSADAYYTDTPVIYGFQSGVFGIMNQNLSGALYGFGYSSGGNEAQALTNTAAGVPVIGYLGLNDALTVSGSASVGAPQVNGGGNCSIIAYDGYYPFSGYTAGSTVAPANPNFMPILTGKYSFWSYENIETPSSNLGNNVYKWYTNMVSNIDNDILQAQLNSGNSALYGPVTAIRLGDMRVSRSSVGGKITPN